MFHQTNFYLVYFQYLHVSFGFYSPSRPITDKHKWIKYVSTIYNLQQKMTNVSQSPIEGNKNKKA